MTIKIWDRTQDANWDAIDEYIAGNFLKDDPALEAALEASKKAGLPPIHVAPLQGKLLMLLAMAIGARKILEIGTLGGYSTIWLARALPEDGRLITLDANADYAEVARANITIAGLAGRVEVRVGNALETLPQLETESAGPFDLVFIDADKPSTPQYYDWAVRLSRRGSLIVVDNVVREGAILAAQSDNPHVRGLREFYARAGADPRVSATALQTVGNKGHDGLAIVLVISEP
ncbi:MAG: O-methyltransferase [Methyloceanibacter sp.]|uniref:O-methyltransferase n=1 Tax=Methyloceanibacter sp. TaxID=1965321 RepID=UPI003D6D2D28